MKKYIAALMAVIMILSFTACGGGSTGDDLTGKYLCVGESYNDEPLSEPEGEIYLELKKGGKGTYFSSAACGLDWKVDGETITGTITFGAMEDTMTGTIKDGVIDIEVSGHNMRLVKEGVEPPAGSVPSATDGNEENNAASGTEEPNTAAGTGDANTAVGLAGHYTASSAIIEGQEWGILDLKAYDMTEENYLQLNGDGTGTLAKSDEETRDITYDENAGTLTYADGTSHSFSVENDTITIVFPDDDNMTMRYTRD